MTNKIVAIQGNQLSKLNPKTDTSIFLANEIQKKNYKIFYYEPKDLSIINSKVIAKGFFIKFEYNQKKIFTFIFDTTNVGFVNPKYCIKMAMFIHNLKQREIQYLQQSFIIVSSKIVERLLELIFFLQKPVAPVYIINNPHSYSPE